MLSYVLGYSVLFCLLCVAFWLPGVVLAALLWPDRNHDRLGRLTEICLGLAAWISFLLVLAAAGQLNLRAVGLFTAIWAIAAVVLRRRIMAAPAEIVRAPRETCLKWQSIGLPALIVVPCFIVAMGPELSWDASAYHLTLPKLYIAHGGFRPVAMNLYSNWPLNGELLFTVAMLVKDYILATLQHCGFAVLTLHGIQVLCRRSSHPRSAALAAMLFLANLIVVWEMTVAYIDLAYAFFFTAAFAFMFAAERSPLNRRVHLLMCGLCCGLLAGTKVTGFLGAVVLAAISLPAMLSTRTGSRKAEFKALFVWFALPAILLSAPWAVKAAWYTGNPVYPFLHHWLGGPDWSSELAGQFAAWQKSMGMGRGLTDYLLLPFRVILCGRMKGTGEMTYAYFDGRICAAWIVLIPLTLRFGMSQPLVRRCLAASGLYFLLWAVSSQQMRFLIPILPLLSVAAAVAVHEWIGRVRSDRRRRVLPGTCLAAATAVALILNIGNGIVAVQLLHRLWRDGSETVRLSAVEPVWKFANERLPREARVLMLNTNQGFFLDREYLADSCFEASQIADWLQSAADQHEVRKRLVERGITHVLSMKNPRGTVYPLVLWEMLANPHCAQSIYRTDDGLYQLWELTANPRRHSQPAGDTSPAKPTRDGSRQEPGHEAVAVPRQARDMQTRVAQHRPIGRYGGG